MQKIQSKILQTQVRTLSLKLAFCLIKQTYLSSLLPKSSSPPCIPSQPLEPTNKALYLSHIEQVLSQKQNQLIKLQKQLSIREERINNKQYERNIGNLLECMKNVTIMEKKLEYIKERIGVRDADVVAIWGKFEKDSQAIRAEIQGMFRVQYDSMVGERKLLRGKLEQLEELTSYQDYLNQLHEALEAKSRELVQRQAMLSGMGSGNASYYAQQKQSQPTHTSNRKRIKIFNARPHAQMNSQKSHPQSTQPLRNKNEPQPNKTTNSEGYQTNPNPPSTKKYHYHNDTFARDPTSNPMAIPNIINQSSAIMDQNSHSRQISQPDHPDMHSGNISSSNERNQIPIEYFKDNKNHPHSGTQDGKMNVNLNMFGQLNDLSLSLQSPTSFVVDKQGFSCKCIFNKSNNNEANNGRAQCCSVSVQVSNEQLDQTISRLKKNTKILSILAKWFNFSLHSPLPSSHTLSLPSRQSHRKILTLYLWKSKTCFLPYCQMQGIQDMAVWQKLWNKQNNIRHCAGLFPYQELNVKRKRYLELMFEMEKKDEIRKRGERILRAVLRNRGRRERFYVYYFFCRFYVKTCSNSQQKGLKAKLNHAYQTINTVNGTAQQSNNQLISVSSSQVLYQQKINLPNKKSTTSLTPSNPNPQSRTKSPIPKPPSQKILSQIPKVPSSCSCKQNPSIPSQNPKKMDPKLNQLIAQKQRTERLLATQCVKLQGLIKICVTLNSVAFRVHNNAMRKMTQIEYQGKIQELDRQINGLQFRYDLILTKCKLGLANNNNKLSTLESLLDFTNLIK